MRRRVWASIKVHLRMGQGSAKRPVRPQTMPHSRRVRRSGIVRGRDRSKAETTTGTVTAHATMLPSPAAAREPGSVTRAWARRKRHRRIRPGDPVSLRDAAGSGDWRPGAVRGALRRGNGPSSSAVRDRTSDRRQTSWRNQDRGILGVGKRFAGASPWPPRGGAGQRRWTVTGYGQLTLGASAHSSSTIRPRSFARPGSLLSASKG